MILLEKQFSLFSELFDYLCLILNFIHNYVLFLQMITIEVRVFKSTFLHLLYKVINQSELLALQLPLFYEFIWLLLLCYTLI